MEKALKFYGLLLIAGSFGLQAQEDGNQPEQDALVTDRPDQTESSSVVPLGALQVETGAFYEKV